MALDKYPPIAEADVTGLTAALATKENVANKKQTVTNSQTDYPSGKAVTDSLAGKLNTSLLKTTLAGDLDTDIPSIKSVNTALSGKSGLTEDNIFTGINDFTGGELVISNGTPVNAVAGGVVLTIAEVPDAYVKYVADPPQAEVKSYLTIAGIDYVFYDTAGDNPETEYPTCVKVAIGTTDEVATNLVTALKLDTANFSNTSVTKNGLVVTANCKTRGIIGNSITYVNNLVTAADITDNLDSAGHFIGGIDGTAGYKGQVYTDGVKVWICNETDLTTTNDNWRLVNGSTIYDNGTSLAIDGANGTYFEIETDTDGVLSLVNDAIGVQYGVLIENTNTTDVITIVLPVNDKKPSNVITIAPLRCKELSLLRLSSTKRIIEFGELIS